MSTNAKITLHDLPSATHSNFKTVTFFRHCDGYMGKETAQMFYNLFANGAQAKGSLFEAFIANNAKDVELEDFTPHSVHDCFAEYHYHLDCKTHNLVVHFADFDKDPVLVFSGCVTEFINTHSDAVKCVLSISDYNTDRKEVFTPDSMVKQMAQDFETLSRCHKQGSRNANNKSCCKRINRYICFMGDMNLSKEIAAYRQSALELVMSYEEIIFAVDGAQQRQAIKDELNTSRVMIGDQPVAITILD